MLKPVSAARPVDLLHQSSDQIRRAALLVAEIVAESAPVHVVRGPVSQALPPAPPPDLEPTREATILQAQRALAAELKTVQRR
jgi:hypothetical protein